MNHFLNSQFTKAFQRILSIGCLDLSKHLDRHYLVNSQNSMLTLAIIIFHLVCYKR